MGKRAADCGKNKRGVHITVTRQRRRLSGHSKTLWLDQEEASPSIFSSICSQAWPTGRHRVTMKNGGLSNAIEPC